MEPIKTAIPKFEPVKSLQVRTHRGVKNYGDVGVNDFVPEIPMDRTERILRALMIISLQDENDMLAIHQHEKRSELNRFVLLSECYKLIGKMVPRLRCDKDDLDFIWDQIKGLRPVRKVEGGDGLRPWDGDFDFHHEWDMTIFLNKNSIRLPEKEVSISARIKRMSGD